MSGFAGFYNPNVPLLFPGASATAGLAIATTGDKAVLPVPFKCELVQFAVVITDANANAAVVALDQRVTAGSDTGRVEVAEVSKPAENGQGKMYYQKPTSRVVLDEGDEVVVEVKTAAASGVAWAMLIVREIPEVAGNNSKMVSA
jgi:hypothetical protein